MSGSHAARSGVETKNRLSSPFTASFAPISSFLFIKIYGCKREELEKCFQTMFQALPFIELAFLFICVIKDYFKLPKLCSCSRIFSSSEAEQRSSLNYESFQSSQQFTSAFDFKRNVGNRSFESCTEQRSFDSRCSGFSSERQRNLKYFPTFSSNSKAARQINRHWGEMTRKSEEP